MTELEIYLYLWEIFSEALAGEFRGYESYSVLRCGHGICLEKEPPMSNSPTKSKIFYFGIPKNDIPKILQLIINGINPHFGHLKRITSPCKLLHDGSFDGSCWNSLNQSVANQVQRMK